MSKIGLIFPTPLEIPDSVQYKGERRSQSCEDAKNNEIQRYQSKSNDISLLVSGIGYANAEKAIEKLAHESEIEYFILIGFCGAINPSLKPGDLFIPDEIRYLDHIISIKGEILDQYKAFLGLQGIDFKPGRIETHHKIVTSKKGMRDLPTAVDMESYGAVTACQNFKRPLLIVRSILSLIPEEPESISEYLKKARANLSTARRSLDKALKDYL